MPVLASTRRRPLWARLGWNHLRLWGAIFATAAVVVVNAVLTRL